MKTPTFADPDKVIPIRAAQYVRMSTEHQKYSTENQADIISQYAAQRGFEIVQTYGDAGKSGLSIEGRDALKQLIADVEAGVTTFNAILVYDWPGNVRELVHAVERAFSAAMDTGTIHPFHLPPEIRARSVFQGLEKEPGKPGMNMEPPDLPGMLEFPTLKDYLDAAEKHYLLALMQRVAGRREEAVRLSGLSQSKLYQALKQHAIPGFRGSRT